MTSNLMNHPSFTPYSPAAPAAPVVQHTAASLSTRAMNVTLHLSAWRAARLDRKATDDTLFRHNAAVDAGRFEKHLVPPKALEGVTKAHNRARARHYQLTLPWGDEGVRILASTAFFDYSHAMDEERSNCERAYDAFCADYPRLLSLAPKELGSLYHASDFPSVHEIAHKFGFQLVVLPVPDQQDFRVALGEEHERAIRQSIEQVVTERYSSAQQDLWSRLLDAVQHFAATMKAESASGKAKVFRDTTVTKLAEIARLAPKLSLTKDERLEAMCAEVLELTAGVTPNALRESRSLRTEAARNAQATLAKITASMEGAF